MTSSFKIVDLFAGPGGLAEGFASVRNSDGTAVFDIALSVEKEPSAFATLRLRAFKQPEHLTAARLTSKPLPLSWTDQRRELGLA